MGLLNEVVETLVKNMHALSSFQTPWPFESSRVVWLARNGVLGLFRVQVQAHGLANVRFSSAELTLEDDSSWKNLEGACWGHHSLLTKSPSPWQQNFHSDFWAMFVMTTSPDNLVRMLGSEEKSQHARSAVLKDMRKKVGSWAPSVIPRSQKRPYVCYEGKYFGEPGGWYMFPLREWLKTRTELQFLDLESTLLFNLPLVIRWKGKMFPTTYNALCKGKIRIQAPLRLSREEVEEPAQNFLEMLKEELYFVEGE